MFPNNIKRILLHPGLNIWICAMNINNLPFWLNDDLACSATDIFKLSACVISWQYVFILHPRRIRKIKNEFVFMMGTVNKMIGNNGIYLLKVDRTDHFLSYCTPFVLFYILLTLSYWYLQLFTSLDRHSHKHYPVIKWIIYKECLCPTSSLNCAIQVTKSWEIEDNIS